jgi:hypothetical protein
VEEDGRGARRRRWSMIWGLGEWCGRRTVAGEVDEGGESLQLCVGVARVEELDERGECSRFVQGLLDLGWRRRKRKMDSTSHHQPPPRHTEGPSVHGWWWLVSKEQRQRRATRTSAHGQCGERPRRVGLLLDVGRVEEGHDRKYAARTGQLLLRVGYTESESESESE